jgi:hypothetical protein
MRSGGASLVERMIHLSELKERAKGKGPRARVARMVLAQMREDTPKPL